MGVFKNVFLSLLWLWSVVCKNSVPKPNTRQLSFKPGGDKFTNLLNVFVPKVLYSILYVVNFNPKTSLEIVKFTLYIKIIFSC